MVRYVAIWAAVALFVGCTQAPTAPPTPPTLQEVEQHLLKTYDWKTIELEESSPGEYAGTAVATDGVELLVTSVRVSGRTVAAEWKDVDADGEGGGGGGSTSKLD